MDVLWSAGRFSSQTEDVEVHACDKDPSKTVEMFLIVGGIRLGLFVVFCAIWLALLGKYNKVLKEEAKLLREGGVTIEESAEMHKLLEDEEKLQDAKVNRATPGGWHDSPQMKYADDDEERTLTHTAGRDYAEYVYERELAPEEDEDEMERFKEEQNSSRIVVPPRLNRFEWQRGEPSTAGGAPTQSYQSVPHGEYDNDAEHPRSFGHGAQKSEGWSAGIFSRVAEAVGWYQPVPSQEEERAPRERIASQQEWEREFYDRRPSNVNVHNPRSMPTPQHSGDSTSSLPQYSMANIPSTSQPPPAPSSGAAHQAEIAHARQGSKLGISAWFRRDASDSVDERDASFAEPTLLHLPKNQSRSAPSAASSSHRRSESQERRAAESRHSASRQNAGGRDSSNPTSPSSGDSLPHMPALEPVSQPKKTTYSHHGANPQDSEEDEGDYWMQEGDIITRDSLSALDHQRREPTYVRTLGKLVRKLSAIESVGSGERRNASNISQETSAASPISPIQENQLNVPNERRTNARSASSIGDSFPGAWTKKF